MTGWRRPLLVAAAVVAVAIALWVALRIPRTLAIFLIAAFVASAVGPTVRRLERRMHVSLAIATVFVTLLLALVVVALLVIPAAVVQFEALLANAPDYVIASQDVVKKAQVAWMNGCGTRVPFPHGFELQNEIGSRVGDAIGWFVASLGTLLVNAATTLLVGIAALILSYFLVAQRQSIRSSTLALLPVSRRDSVGALLDEIAMIFGAYVGGQVLLTTIVGVAIWVALTVLHCNFALLVAVIGGIAYAVPVFGMLFTQVLAALLALPQGGWEVAWVSVAIFAIGRVADYVLVPKIMSESVGVSPIAVIFVVAAGGELFGVPGLILGIPAAALARVLFKYFVTPYIVQLQTRPPESGPVVGVAVEKNGESVIVEVR